MGGRGMAGGTSTTGFKDGDTPKVIDLNKNYTMVKMTGRMSTDTGSLPGSDVRDILKGMTFNGFFWSKRGTSTIYTVREVK